MTGDIYIYNVIGPDASMGEVSAENIRHQLKANKDAEELTLHIISPGGDVFEGYSIYNALKNSGKKITTHIEGTCASIATLVAAAGENIIMNRTAQFMIHNPKVSGLSSDADSKRLRNVADQLDQIKSILIDVYERKTGLSKEKLWELYDNETWMSAVEAEQMGFIDESVDAIKAVASFDLTNFTNNMKDAKETSILQGLINRFSNLLKYKNEQSVTLEDGTVILVMSEDGDFTGKTVTREDGSPLEPGDYKITDGRTITVGEGSTITEVKDAEPAAVAEPNKEEDMKKDEEIANLKAQLAEAKAQATTASASAVKFENRLKTVEKEFLTLKEEALKTLGEPAPQGKGPVFKNVDNPAMDFDPMGEEVKKNLKSRNIID